MHRFKHLNFYIAGMKASTTYYLHQDYFNGSALIAYGPVLTFTTGAIPAVFTFLLILHARRCSRRPNSPTQTSSGFRLRAFRDR